MRPQNATQDPRDSHAYRRTSDDDDRTTGHVPLPFQNSGTGLAAGGWTSFAQGVLAITAELADR